MNAALEDPRIFRGMTAQLARRRALLKAGHKSLGWKLAFGSPAAMERLHTNAPLVGFLMQSALVPSGALLSASGWTKPAVEPEIALYLGKDLRADSDRATVMEAIADIGPAIEIADVDHPSEDVEGTLARNIYQRHVVLGRKDPSRAGAILDALTARVIRNTAEIANTMELQTLTGELGEVVQHLAHLLGACGELLLAGQIIIAGSITPPIWVEPGEEIIFDLHPIDRVSICFAPRSDVA
ncbi:MAG TPA: fumarylacetoacetate hydrolase family protein [Candidatus Acidoferrum sp.]|nr:fumarylacetoacetate hydrolase family protein [Candidatus Acidoferrum sp.]